jgi:hypothetical protein
MALGSTQPLVKMSTRNFPGGKGGRCVRLTTSPSSHAECHEIWGPKPTGSLWATPGLLRDSFTFTYPSKFLAPNQYICHQRRSEHEDIYLSSSDSLIKHAGHLPTDINIIRRMRFAFRVSEAKNTLSEYVKPIAFPLQIWFREGASVLSLYTHCLCFSSTI